MKRKVLCLWFVCSSTVLINSCFAETPLGVEDAVKQALATRASLKADQARITAAEGAKKQAGLWPNPEFQFQNENLRPGQTYSKDVDTLAMINQYLDVLGKRPARVAAAEQNVTVTAADYESSKWRVALRVRQAYWSARGLQEIRDLLKNSAEAFQKTVDYHAARFETGAIAEQDLLRVRLEHERLQIAANTAGIDASRARIDLLREMGQQDNPDLVLTEPLSVSTPPMPLDIEQVLSQRADIRSARAAVELAKANAHVQDVAARPDLNLTAGYKRTELPDTATGINTAIVSLRITLPTTDKNQGNRAAALAEVHRAEQSLAAIETDVRAEYAGAREEMQLRQRELDTMLQPMREHAATIAQIANGAYEQGATDLLRFLDAERASLDAQVAWTRGMIEYRMSVVRLEAAEGANQ